MNKRKETTETKRDIEEPTSRSKVEFLEKENEEVHEDQLERSTEILLRTVAEQETQDDQDLEDLSNYTLTRDR